MSGAPHGARPMKMHGRFVAAGHGPHDAVIVAGVAARRSCAEIARTCGVCRSYVYTRRLRLGLPIAENALRPGDKFDGAIRAALLAGQSRGAIAHDLGLSREFVQNRAILLVGPRWKWAHIDSLSPKQRAEYQFFRRKHYSAAEALDMALREAA